MATFVIDASALLAGHDDSTMATAIGLEALEGEHVLLAPALLSSETGHVIHRKRPERYGRSVEERTSVQEILLRDIELVQPDAAARSACARLAARTGLSWYDAEYLALAQARGAPMITQDLRLLAAGLDVLGRGGAMTIEEAIRDHVTVGPAD